MFLTYEIFSIAYIYWKSVGVGYCSCVSVVVLDNVHSRGIPDWQLWFVSSQAENLCSQCAIVTRLPLMILVIDESWFNITKTWVKGRVWPKRNGCFGSDYQLVVMLISAFCEGKAEVANCTNKNVCPFTLDCTEKWLYWKVTLLLLCLVILMLFNAVYCAMFITVKKYHEEGVITSPWL